MVLADGDSLVAILALDGSVGAEERETILVILELLDSDIPTLHSVTFGAARAHLPLVNIGMTVLAIFSYVRKNWFNVALRALHFLMHAAQWIFGFVVVKFRVRADGTPSGGGVAVFTRYGESAVRTSSSPLLRRLGGRVGWLPRKQ